MTGQEYAVMPVLAGQIIHDDLVIDPETGRDEIAAVFIKDGVIQAIIFGAGVSACEARLADVKSLHNEKSTWCRFAGKI